MACCDFYNEVYDAKCNFLGAPDGGFTGKGDGKIPDFFEEAKSEKLVWGTPKQGLESLGSLVQHYFFSFQVL